MTTPIAQRVTDAQERLTEARDSLHEHLEGLDNTNVTDDQMAVTNELTDNVAKAEKNHEMLKKAEKALGQTTAIVPVTTGDPGITVRNPRPFAVPATKVNPEDYVIRSLACMLQSRIQQRNPLDVMRERYGEDESTRVVYNHITRAAVVPADTTTSGWATQLVETSVQGFIPALLPNSVYPRLSSMGSKFTFGRAGIVSDTQTLVNADDRRELRRPGRSNSRACRRSDGDHFYSDEDGRHLGLHPRYCGTLARPRSKG